MNSSCKNCGCNKIDCGCKDSFLTSPAPCPTPENCPEEQPCSEVFDAQCIIYTGEDIECNNQTVVATNDTLAEALNNIVISLCGGAGNPFKYEIGEYVPTEGGVIVDRWVSQTAFGPSKNGGIENYLVLSITNTSEAVWSNVDNIEIGATAQSPTDGLANSNAVITQAGAAFGASKDCLDLVTAGKSDWYLPSITELNTINQNRFVISNTLSTISGSDAISIIPSFPSQTYWSSTEINAIEAFLFSFAFSNGGTASKNTTANVRAVRKFTYTP